jgi:hypothetical protein
MQIAKCKMEKRPRAVRGKTNKAKGKRMSYINKK